MNSNLKPTLGLTAIGLALAIGVSPAPADAPRDPNAAGLEQPRGAALPNPAPLPAPTRPAGPAGLTAGFVQPPPPPGPRDLTAAEDSAVDAAIGLIVLPAAGDPRGGAHDLAAARPGAVPVWKADVCDPGADAVFGCFVEQVACDGEDQGSWHPLPDGGGVCIWWQEDPPDNGGSTGD